MTGNEELKRRIEQSEPSGPNEPSKLSKRIAELIEEKNRFERKLPRQHNKEHEPNIVKLDDPQTLPRIGQWVILIGHTEVNYIRREFIEQEENPEFQVYFSYLALNPKNNKLYWVVDSMSDGYGRKLCEGDAWIPVPEFFVNMIREEE